MSKLREAIKLEMNKKEIDKIDKGNKLSVINTVKSAEEVVNQKTLHSCDGIRKALYEKYYSTSTDTIVAVFIMLAIGLVLICAGVYDIRHTDISVESTIGGVPAVVLGEILAATGTVSIVESYKCRRYDRVIDKEMTEIEELHSTKHTSSFLKVKLGYKEKASKTEKSKRASTVEKSEKAERFMTGTFGEDINITA